MEQKSLIKLKLLKEAEIFKFGEKANNLIALFANNPDCIKKPQEAFITASSQSGLTGSDSMVLATRIKCSNAIAFIFKEMGIECDVDAIDAKLMAISQKKE